MTVDFRKEELKIHNRYTAGCDVEKVNIVLKLWREYRRKLVITGSSATDWH